ncbi:MAG: HPr family phosphocarrier protein [Bacillota bacterium]
MVEARVVVRTGVGLHARPAALLVQEAVKHPCRVTIEYGGKKADAKSILQVLAMGVRDSEELVIRAEGEGESEALASLVSLFVEGLKGP